MYKTIIMANDNLPTTTSISTPPSTPPAMSSMTSPPPLVRENAQPFREEFTDHDIVDLLYARYSETYGQRPIDLHEIVDWIEQDLIPNLESNNDTNSNPDPDTWENMSTLPPPPPALHIEDLNFREAQ